MNYDDMDVLELRRLARQRGVPAATVASATHGTLQGILDAYDHTGTPSQKGQTLAQPVPAVPVQTDSLAAVLAAAISGHLQIKNIPDMSAIEQLIDKKLADIGRAPLQLELITPDGGVQPLGMVHKATPRILKYVSLGQHVFLSGPAGSGKTSVAAKVAEALKLTLWPLSVGAQTTKTDLFGFIDGNGKYHTTPFREAFEKGGVFLLDEIDAGNPNVLVALNSALSGAPEIFFPDGLVKRHKDFRCIAAANTWGHGADRQYVGRNQLDAATLNRFLQVTFDYDEELETAIAGNARWSRRVQALRKSVFTLKARVMVTPRASINGAVLVAAGDTFEQAEEATIWASVDSDTKSKILAGVR